MIRLHNLITSLPAEKVICIDAEFANNSGRGANRMLELSVWDGSGSLSYFKRYRPAGMKDWNLEPHNITPEMVKDAPAFAACRKEVQQLIDDADYIVGFALENDIKILRGEGIRIPEDKKIVEVKDWFWLLYGRGHELDYLQNINNSSVAAHLGEEISSDSLHASDYDARITFESFSRLLDLADIKPDESLGDVFARVTEDFRIKKADYDEEQARGFCFIEKRERGYRFKASRTRPEASENIIALIEVADRKEALREFGKRLAGESRTSSFSFPELTDRQLRRFKNYSNTFSKEDGDLSARQLAMLENRFNHRH